MRDSFVMENIQINGQKIWGPPKNWVGPPPPHGTEVFIKNIPDYVFEDELYNLFSSIGQIYEVRLPVYWNGINKGFAFARYTKISEADAAIQKLNNFLIRPRRQIKVERSLDNTRLFLSSVPNEKTGEEIKAILLTVVENVKTVYVYQALENKAMFRGYAFVEFLCHRDAAIAKRILTPYVLFNLFERKCIAAWAKPLPILDKGTLKMINILFIRNVPNNTTNNSIKAAVDSLTSPDKVCKVKRVNDFAFLTYEDHDVAERAMNKIINNPFLLGRKAVLVEWAIPRKLANSFTLKNLDGENYDQSVLNFDSELESCRSALFKMGENFMENQLKFVMEDDSSYIENVENDPFSNNINVRILPSTPKCKSFPVLNDVKTIVGKNDPKANTQSCLRENNINKPSKFCPQLQDENCSPQERGLLMEYCDFNWENYCRSKHLTNWLQSLALTDQPTNCASSPTSPSTGSSTNLSWNEGCSQFSFGSGNSLGNDSRAPKIKYNAENLEGFAWF